MTVGIGVGFTKIVEMGQELRRPPGMRPHLPALVGGTRLVAGTA